MANYDKAEAAGILAWSHARLVPHAHADQRSKAAGELLRALVDSVRGTGYEERNDTHARVLYIGIPRVKGVYITRDAYDNIGMTAMDAKTEIPLAIEYDPITNTFVGTENERALVGQKPSRRDALVVLTETIAKAVFAAR